MTHWIADSLTLWKSPLTDAHLYTAAAYYSLLAKMNVGMAASAVAVVTIGAMALVLSVQDGEAGNLMFDGASICTSCLFFVYFGLIFNGHVVQSYIRAQLLSTCILSFPSSPNSQTSLHLLQICPASLHISGSQPSSLRPRISFAQWPSLVSLSSKQRDIGQKEKKTTVPWTHEWTLAKATGNARLVL